jgi:hypothetical protein
MEGRRIKSITPSEFNNYVSQPGETADMSDFTDPRIIMQAKPYKMWPALKNMDTAKKMGRSSSDIYILTARSPKAIIPIHNLFSRNGIDIPEENILAIGNDDGEASDIPSEKARVLRWLKDKYDEVMFYDDSPHNIELASKIGGIKTRLIDWNK